MENNLEKGMSFFAITVALILVFAVSVMFILSLGYIASFVVKKITGKDHALVVMPVTSIAISVISIIVGMIMYANDHSFMNIMRGFEAELVWLLLSMPAVVVAVVQFIRYAVKKRGIWR